VRAKRGVHAAFFAALACTGSSAVHANERTSSLSSIEGGAPTIDVRADRVGPRVATWEELARDGFDLAWILPEELPVARDDGKGPAVDLVTEQQRLLALRDETAGSTPATFGDVVLAVTGLDRVFAATIYGDEVANGKPAPDMYLKVLERMGVAPARAVGIEDSGNGIRSLAAAGMGIVAAPGPGYPLSAEVLALAGACIESMTQLDAGVVERAAARSR